MNVNDEVFDRFYFAIDEFEKVRESGAVVNLRAENGGGDSLGFSDVKIPFHIPSIMKPKKQYRILVNNSKEPFQVLGVSFSRRKNWIWYSLRYCTWRPIAILSDHQLVETADKCMVLDKETLYDICLHNLNLVLVILTSDSQPLDITISNMLLVVPSCTLNITQANICLHLSAPGVCEFVADLGCRLLENEYWFDNWRLVGVGV
ncbi:hypothetical protein AgCh_028517 [Apium graveolens]